MPKTRSRGAIRGGRGARSSRGRAGTFGRQESTQPTNGEGRQFNSSGEELLNDSLSNPLGHLGSPVPPIGGPILLESLNNSAMPPMAEPSSDLGNSPMYSLISACPLLGAHVSTAIKAKIWSSTYVDLTTLLPSNGSRTEASAGFYVSVNPVSNQLMLQNQPSTRVISNIFEWTTAFHTFMAIFMERHPSRTAELFRYMELIRFAFKKFGGFGWRAYDIEFRTQQSVNPARSWAVMDGVLWLQIFTPSSATSSPFRTPPQNQRSTPYGNVPSQGRRICFSFNSRAGCTRQSCSYPHACQSCGSKGHSKFACSRKQRPQS
jgi:hypothetical protein